MRSLAADKQSPSQSDLEASTRKFAGLQRKRNLY